MKNDYYSDTYIPGIVKWGKVALLLGIFTESLPALVMAFRGYMPPMLAIIAGTLMQISVSGTFYIVEPISYFPILGIPGTYPTFLLGNTSNMRVSCSSVAQEAAGVEVGTEGGSIIPTIDIATSILINIVILTMGAVMGDVILNILPVPVKEALNFLLPALFGTVFGQFATARPKLGVVAAIIAIEVNWLVRLGFLSFIPDNPSYVAILVAVFGSIYMSKLLYRKGLQAD